MDPVLLQRFWDNARQLLLGWRVNPAGTIAGLKSQLLDQASTIDINRRTTPFNLPSLNQEAIDKIIGDTLYVANLWIKAGRPPGVPNV